MPRWSLRLLGPFVLERDDGPVEGFRSDKVRALLAYLAVQPGRFWSRSALADLLWPDRPEAVARANLRNALSNLRQVLDDRHGTPPYLEAMPAGVRVNPAVDHWVDVAEVRGLLDAVPCEPEDADDPRTVGQLERALALLRGDFLDGFDLQWTDPGSVELLFHIARGRGAIADRGRLPCGATISAAVTGRPLPETCDLLSREAGRRQRLVMVHVVRPVAEGGLGIYRFRSEFAQRDRPAVERLEGMADAMERYRLSGTRLGRSALLTHFARACVEADQPERGLAAVNAALAASAHSGERWVDAETWRTKADLLGLRRAGRRHDERSRRAVGACLRTALRIANAQGARALARRAEEAARRHRLT